MPNLNGKTAIVTGGSRGIGAAIAKRLAAEGASVAITYTKGAEAAAAVVKEIERAGSKAIAIQADATDAAAVQRAVEKTVATFGQIDVLVNNAGTALPKPFEETTLEEMNLMIDINFRGVLATTHAALKHLNNGGRIITIGSCVGERVLTPGLVAYAATKGAVKNIHPRAGPRSGRSRNYGEQHSARSDRHRFEPRVGRLGHSANRQYRAASLRPSRRSRRPGGIRRQPGSLVHYRVLT